MAQLNLTELVNMELFDENGVKYDIHEGFPEGIIHQPNKINNTLAFHVPVGKKNMIIFQLIATPNGSICISDYWFPERMSLICKSPEPILEFYATFSGKVDMHLEDDHIRSADAGTYNLVSAPSVYNKATLNGYIKTVDFHPNLDYIERLSTTLPILNKFLKAMLTGQTLTLHKEEGDMSFRAAFLYVDLIRKVHEENIGQNERTRLIHTILKLMIQPETPTYTKMPFTYEKLMAISHTVNHVKSYLEENYTVADLHKLATKFNALNYKLMLDSFKAIYGKTPMAYIKELKMIKAKEYFDSHKTEATVAGRLGYRYLTHLERDFKAFHEISIKAYKQQIKKKAP